MLSGIWKELKMKEKKIPSIVPDILGTLYSTSSTHQRAGLGKRKENTNLLHTACNAPVTVLYPLSTPLSTIFPLPIS
jgi:hypothetical protein